MSKFWNLQTTDSQETRDGGEGDSLKLIPLWSIVLAVLVFAGSIYFFNHAAPVHRRPGSLPMHLITGYITGTVLASYSLVVGFVSRDVKRRGMSAGLWMLVVIFMPGLIGAVVYFLLRQPIMVRCPNCTTELIAVPLSGGAGVRSVLPRRADYRCVLSAVRPRNRRRSRSGQAARLQR
jgi:hypothetical protein